MPGKANMATPHAARASRRANRLIETSLVVVILVEPEDVEAVVVVAERAAAARPGPSEPHGEQQPSRSALHVLPSPSWVEPVVPPAPERKLCERAKVGSKSRPFG